MPDFAGPIKFPVPADRYNTAYGEPQWWKELAQTADAAISAKADVGHNHDGRYYTETEMDTKLAGKSATGHTHSALSNGTFSVDLSSAGAFALRSGSSNTVQWNASNGNLVAGNVPWARVTDKPTSFPSAWADVSGKPSTYPPETHTHSGLNNGAFTFSVSAAGALAANAGGGNTLQFDMSTGRMIAGEVPWARISGVPATTPPAWADVTGKPSVFTPAAHDHTMVKNGAYEAGLSSAGAFFARSGATNTWQIDANSGRLIAGEVPWARLSGAPDTSALAVLAYDSGPRDVSALLSNGWTGTAWLQRTGKDVQLRLEGVKAPSTGSTSPFAFPAGFKPRGTGFAARGLVFTTDLTVRRYDVAATTSALTIRNHNETDLPFYSEVSFKTNDPIPTALPGV